MLSFWEKKSLITYDYGVIGSGIVGLSTAISIKEKQPEASVVIFESGLLPTGASTKNAGFACFGSVTELLEDIKAMGESKALELVKERHLGLVKLRERLGDKKLDYLNHGGYELIRDQELFCIKEIDYINGLLADIFEEKPFEENQSLVKAFGFDQNVVKTVIHSRYEAQIDTGEMMKNLMQMAQQLGIIILTGAKVDRLENESSGVNVIVGDHTYGIVSFKVGRLAVCTNAFTKKLIKDIELFPGRGLVLITKPIENLKFKGVFHLEKGYYYFRNFGNRVIFGGGRNLDYEKETTTEFAVNEDIKKELQRLLKEVILPDTPYEIDDCWTGIMAFGKNKQPVLEQYAENIFIGVRLGGMGVAIGSRMGQKMAEKLLQMS